MNLQNSGIIHGLNSRRVLTVDASQMVFQAIRPVNNQGILTAMAFPSRRPLGSTLYQHSVFLVHTLIPSEDDVTLLVP